MEGTMFDVMLMLLIEMRYLELDSLYIHNLLSLSHAYAPQGPPSTSTNFYGILHSWPSIQYQWNRSCNNCCRWNAAVMLPTVLMWNTSLDQVGLLEMGELVEATGDLMVLGDSFVQSVF